MVGSRNVGFFSEAVQTLDKSITRKGESQGLITQGRKNETGNLTTTQKFLLFRKRFTDITRFPFTFQPDIVLENICK